MRTSGQDDRGDFLVGVESKSPIVVSRALATRSKTAAPGITLPLMIWFSVITGSPVRRANARCEMFSAASRRLRLTEMFALAFVSVTVPCIPPKYGVTYRDATASYQVPQMDNVLLLAKLNQRARQADAALLDIARADELAEYDRGHWAGFSAALQHVKDFMQEHGEETKPLALGPVPSRRRRKAS